MTTLDLTADHPARPTPAPPVSPTLPDAVRDAAKVLGPGRPIRAFVATDPLGRLHEHHRLAAIAEVAEVTGSDGLPSEAELRTLHRAGRITDAHLERALAHRGLGHGAPALGEHGDLDPMAILVADLVHGTSDRPAPPTAILAAARLDAADGQRRGDAIDRCVARWAGGYVAACERGDTWAGSTEGGVWDVGRRLAAHDPELRRWAGRAGRRLVGSAPDDPLVALAEALDRLAVAEHDRTRYLRAHLGRLPGWSSHLAWRAEHGGPDDLTGWLALRCWTEAAVVSATGADAATEAAGTPPSTAQPPRSDPWQRAGRALEALGRTDVPVADAASVLATLPIATRRVVWQEALELAVADDLLGALDGPAGSTDVPTRPSADVVTCIDVRAEPLRRHLPAERVRTHGFAGFFGLPMTWRPLGGEPAASCPVPVPPTVHLEEAAVDASAARRGARHDALRHAHDAEQRTARAPAAPYLLAEVAGWGAAARTTARTLAPGATARAGRRLRDRLAPPAATRPVIDPDAAPASTGGTGGEARGSAPTGLDLAAQVAWAEGVLRSLGLAGRTGAERAGRLLVLVGHGATSANNPLAAGLACGACGGRSGAPNARAAAGILNAPAVRQALDERGVGLPTDTVVVAAEHDTTTDAITLLDLAAVPASHRDELTELAAILDDAASAVAVERCATLPGAPTATTADPNRARRHVEDRAHDWAQVVPEWGLAGNAALVIAPRASVAGRDLAGRAFLCDHHPDLDPDGALLAGVLGGPLVVAQGINAHYAAAASDPHRMGSGSKVLHNVVAGVGVLEGAAGDLRQALPVQSVRDGERLAHEPVRLLVVVEAPLDRLDRAIAAVEPARHLIDGEWVRLVARARPGDPWSERLPGGRWRPWSDDRPSHRSEESTCSMASTS